jgi:membrane-associated phospholipid phosphatase
MVSITQIAQSVDIGILKEIGLVLNEPIIYGTILIVLAVAGAREKKKIGRILFSLALAALLGLAAKEAFSHARPCTGEEWCPGGYSFPSTHAVTAFALMAAFIRRKEFPLYLMFALFVSFTRINIGVHVFQDIVAALPIALIAYYVTWIVVGNED